MGHAVVWIWNVSKGPDANGFGVLSGGGGAIKRRGLGGLKSMEDLSLKDWHLPYSVSL